jgi:hypothetical protein
MIKKIYAYICFNNSDVYVWYSDNTDLLCKISDPAKNGENLFTTPYGLKSLLWCCMVLFMHFWHFCKNKLMLYVEPHFRPQRLFVQNSDHIIFVQNLWPLILMQPRNIKWMQAEKWDFWIPPHPPNIKLTQPKYVFTNETNPDISLYPKSDGVHPRVSYK